MTLPPRLKDWLQNPCFDSITVIAASVIFMIVTGNHAFWSSLFSVIDLGQPGMLLVAVASFGVIFAVCFVFLAVFGIGHALKPLIGFLLIVSSLTSYYMDEYGIFFDDVMLLSILETTWHEARDLFETGIITHFILTGLIPLYLLYRVRICARPFRQALLRRSAAVLIVVTVAGSVLFASYKDFSFVFREHRETGFLVNPVYPVRSAVRIVRAELAAYRYPFIESLKDAHRRPAATEDTRQKKPRVLVIVVGETARAQNFGLDGYARNTTPYLEKQHHIVNFSDVSACGTATAISLPCLFSDFEHDRFDGDAARSRQNLLDAFSIAGLNVLWRENNPDCKGVCKRIPTQSPEEIYVEDLCHDGLCFDEVLIRGLDDYLQTINGDTVIVLHEQGSHGPAYYQRYPQAFKRFEPECRTSTVQDCSQEEVVNAYDNTIAYTDYFLSQLIDFLKTREDSISPAMIYVSDHGESLGEYGVYLHGLPYFVAPEYQTKVPMIFWSSPGFEQAATLDYACLQRKADKPWSHDNFFHSLMGLMDVQASLYQPEEDIFASCRKAQ
ncbi:MAG TPA: phosphoethanolamine--lipid A transferase [Gammaproteobacteria bacterium]|nr:phosphoethanolamine--lipid A transferase [Gammaproteobacteria bacterium]